MTLWRSVTVSQSMVEDMIGRNVEVVIFMIDHESVDQFAVSNGCSCRF